MPKKRKYNRHGTARERYLAEYHESRMFKAYLDSTYDFQGDTAKLNGYRSWQLRHIPSFKRVFKFKKVEYFIVANGHLHR